MQTFVDFSFFISDTTASEQKQKFPSGLDDFTL